MMQEDQVIASLRIEMVVKQENGDIVKAADIEDDDGKGGKKKGKGKSTGSGHASAGQSTVVK
jgi:hypothetical protein